MTETEYEHLQNRYTAAVLYTCAGFVCSVLCSTIALSALAAGNQFDWAFYTVASMVSGGVSWLWMRRAFKARIAVRNANVMIFGKPNP